MYKQRKNFLSYEVPSAETKKAEAKKILSSIFETSAMAALDSIYQAKEFDKAQRVSLAQDLPFSQPGIPAAAQNLAPVSDTLLTVGKLPTEGDTVVVGIKKPIHVVFRDDSQATPQLAENTAVMEDDILAPIEDAPVAVKQSLEDYDFLDSAPPLDLSSELQNTVVSRSQGMMSNVQMASQLAPSVLHKGDKIQGIENDPDGWSVVGLDNDIGMSMLS